MKNSQVGLNSRLETAEERADILKGDSRKSKLKNREKMFRNKQCLSDLWDSVKRANVRKQKTGAADKHAER